MARLEAFVVLELFGLVVEFCWFYGNGIGLLQIIKHMAVEKVAYSKILCGFILYAKCN